MPLLGNGGHVIHSTPCALLQVICNNLFNAYAMESQAVSGAGHTHTVHPPPECPPRGGWGWCRSTRCLPVVWGFEVFLAQAGREPAGGFSGAGVKETMDPHAQRQFVDIARHKAVFNKLVDLDATLRPVPRLASCWSSDTSARVCAVRTA